MPKEKFHEMVARVHAAHPALKKAQEIYMKRNGVSPKAALSSKVKPITPASMMAKIPSAK